MVKIVRYEDLYEKEIIEEILNGKIFIYPSDTVYRIGCDATNVEAILKIRYAKDKEQKPFSVIAPSKSWILKNFKVNKRYIEKLPGPFTYILKKKKKNIIPLEVSTIDVLGIRIPDHKFTKIIQKTKRPFITADINKIGKKPITNINKIPRKILKYIDIIIDDGEIDNSPSSIIDMRNDIPQIVKR